MKRIIYSQNITQKELGMKNLFLKRFFKLHVFILLNVIINTQSFGANIYGRLDFSLNEINKFSLGSETKAVSNSSRLGLRVNIFLKMAFQHFINMKHKLILLIEVQILRIVIVTSD